MSGFLALKMIFGFPKSNNPHRFRVEAESFVEKVLEAGDDVYAILGSFGFNTTFSMALMRKYGSAHGTKSQLSSDDGEDEENEVKEGCVRFQCCANNPVSDIADWNSLCSIRSLGEKSGSIKPSHKQYEKLITKTLTTRSLLAWVDFPCRSSSTACAVSDSSLPTPTG
jgi:hypothetical protein